MAPPRTPPLQFTMRKHQRLRVQVYTRDGFACRDCGAAASPPPEYDGRYALHCTGGPGRPGSILELDHIVPRARGGANTEENLQTLCQSCNSRKAHHYYMGFRPMNTKPSDYFLIEDDFLERTRHLSVTGMGAYANLMCHAWEGVEGLPWCHLPNDPEKLARLAGATPEQWAGISGDVLKFFEPSKEVPGLLFHPRLMTEGRA